MTGVEHSASEKVPTADGTCLNPLPVGTRISHRRHPELTGRIQRYEWNSRGVLSSIPYCIAWDDDSWAYDLLGWFFMYASDDSVERVETTLLIEDAS